MIMFMYNTQKHKITQITTKICFVMQINVN
jgi:hypothetical protein